MTLHNQLVVRDPDAGELALPDDLVTVARSFIAEARADQTRAAYGRAWRLFETWCGSHGRKQLPASPETVAAWLSAMATGADGRKPLARSSINQALSAVLLAHRTAGHSFDRKHPLIAETWRGISRVKAKADVVRKAKPVLATDLQAILDTLRDGKRRSTLATRDRALLALGWAGALRRSELVGLDWQTLGTGQGFVTIDERGVSITLATSKASQDAAVTVVIPKDDMPTAGEALEAWAMGRRARARRSRVPPGGPVREHRGLPPHRTQRVARCEG